MGRAASLSSRFWVYQRERFPLATHGLLVAVITIGAFGYSGAARQGEDSSDLLALLAAYLVAYIVTLGFFFQLRVADEYKDYADDLAFRPYRPVPRGLIQLNELAMIALGVGAIQLALTIWLQIGLLWFLLSVWLYLLLMRVEFFAPEWLTARPLLYMLSHMVILPLIFLYITACEWWVAGSQPPLGIGWLLSAGFFNGIVFEIGRKIRSAEDEEEGVETYSKLWGRQRAVIGWGSAVALAGVSIIGAAWVVGIGWIMGPLVILLAAGAGYVGFRFVQRPTTAHAGWFEKYSAVWMLVLYLALGLLPLVLGGKDWWVESGWLIWQIDAGGAHVYL